MASVQAENIVKDCLRYAGPVPRDQRAALNELDRALDAKKAADPSLAEFFGSVKDYIAQCRADLLG